MKKNGKKKIVQKLMTNEWIIRAYFIFSFFTSATTRKCTISSHGKCSDNGSSGSSSSSWSHTSTSSSTSSSSSSSSSTSYSHSSYEHHTEHKTSRKHHESIRNEEKKKDHDKRHEHSHHAHHERSVKRHEARKDEKNGHKKSKDHHNQIEKHSPSSPQKKLSPTPQKVPSPIQQKNPSPTPQDPLCQRKVCHKNEVFKCGSSESCQVTCRGFKKPCGVVYKKAPDVCKCMGGHARNKCNVCIPICSEECKCEMEEACGPQFTETCLNQPATDDTPIKDCKYVCKKKHLHKRTTK